MECREVRVSGGVTSSNRGKIHHLYEIFLCEFMVALVGFFLLVSNEL